MLTAFFLAFLLLAALFAWENHRELNHFKTTHYEVFTDKISPDQTEHVIVLLSDLHNHIYGDANKPLVSAINAINPDMILVAGDMLIGRVGESYEPALSFLKQLPAIAPVYFANGNHEFRMKKYPGKYGTAYKEYAAGLRAAGIHLLENKSERIRLSSTVIRVTGLEISESFYGKFSREQLKTSDIETCAGKSDPASYQILIAHNPALFQTYKDWGADLTVSGHLHGGIIRIPFIGGVISPQARLFPKYTGELTREGQSYIVVSKGLGTHTVNVRFMNPAEIVVLHLKHKSEK